MRTLILPFILSLSVPQSRAQAPYFPPVAPGSTWETIDPATLGWCPDRIDSLYAYLGAHNTKAFLVLKDGRIVLEHYFGTFEQDSLWYWASAGKTLTSTLVGIAQEEGFLDIDQPSDTYLGTGWTVETPGQEHQITVRHQLSMTTGLDDGGSDGDCTAPACLTYLAPPGTRWAYHNAPYTLLDEVVAQATGQSFASYFNAKLRDPIGMDGAWLPIGENHIYFSTARSMARFGLLALNRMVWDGDSILHDTAYFTAATTPSQSINLSYGFLWWLNGQVSFHLPATQLTFPGPIIPTAPPDMFFGSGKEDQMVDVVPSQGLVVLRLGNAPYPGVWTPTSFNSAVWLYMNALDCTNGVATVPAVRSFTIAPDPADGTTRLLLPEGLHGADITVFNSLGAPVIHQRDEPVLDTRNLAPGLYFVHVTAGSGTYVSRFIEQ